MGGNKKNTILHTTFQMYFCLEIFGFRFTFQWKSIKDYQSLAWAITCFFLNTLPNNLNVIEDCKSSTEKLARI